MDHSHDTAPVAGPWAGGWLIAALAGAFAALIALYVGGAGSAPAAAAGVLSFLVHGVLLGSGGVEITDAGDHDGDHDGGHDHGHH